MAIYYKLFWFLRSIFFKLLFKRVGNLCLLGKPIFIYGSKKISIGNKVRIFPHYRFEVHSDGAITIADDVSIGQGFHLISSDSNLLIESGTVISCNVLITNCDHVYHNPNVSVNEQPLIANETRIGKNCFIGAGCVIQAGTILGDQCIVGAGAVVRGVFPANSVLVGTPAKIVKSYDFDKKSWCKFNDK